MAIGLHEKNTSSPRFWGGLGLVCLLACTGGLAQPAMANGPDLGHQQIRQIDRVQTETAYGFRNGSVVVAPVPFSNPMIGNGLGLGAGYLFQTDERSKTSMIGIGAMRSDNGSRAEGVMTNLAFDSNRWLVSAFVGEADVRYDLYTGLGPIPVRQDGILARLNLSYGITEDLSFGIVGRYLETTLRPEFGVLPPRFDPNISLEVVTVGATMDWDMRNNSDYPTEGTRLKIEATQGHFLNGINRVYEKATAVLDAYHPLTEAGTIALRGVICGASGNTPFFDQCSIGATDNMRGFNSTQFLDLRATSVQVEYRHRLSPRWGAVGFAGIGWTGASFNGLASNGSHSAIGLGARYRVSKKFPVDFSVDVSRNNLGDELIYIYVGQRF